MEFSKRNWIRTLKMYPCLLCAGWAIVLLYLFARGSCIEPNAVILILELIIIVASIPLGIAAFILIAMKD